MSHEATLDAWQPGEPDISQFSHLSPTVGEPPAPNHFKLVHGTGTVQDLTVSSLERVGGSLVCQSESRYLNHVKWIVDGDVESYIDAHGSQEWPLPEAFSKYRSDFSRWLHEASGTLTQYGYGIGETAAELAHRALAGKGRFSASNYTLVVCDDAPAVLLGPAGSVLIKPHPINQPSREDQLAATQIEVPGNTLTVEEDNEDVLAGIRRFATILDEEYGATLTDHRHPPRAGVGTHSFGISDFEFTKPGISVDAVTVAPDMLVTLGTINQDPAEVPVHGGGEVKGPIDKNEYRAAWSGPDSNLKPGSVDDHGRIVVGYDVTQPRRGRGRESNLAVTTYLLRYKHEYQSRFVLDTINERIDATPV